MTEVYRQQGDNSKSNKEDLERVHKLIKSLTDEKLSPDLHTQLKDWFHGNDNQVVIEQAFVEFVIKEVTPNKTPGWKEFRSYRRLAKKLNMEVGARISLLRFTMCTYHIGLRIAAIVMPLLVFLETGYLKHVCYND